MGIPILESAVNRSFVTDAKGRTLFCPFKRDRGYVVSSKTEELTIRAFLKVYRLGHAAILFLGYFATYFFTLLQANLWWTKESIQYRIAHPAFGLVVNGGIGLGFALLFGGIPLFFLWRTYKRGVLSFTASLEEVSFSPASVRQMENLQLTSRAPLLITLACMFILIAVVFSAVMFRHYHLH